MPGADPRTPNRPLVVTLCGSSRFPDAFALANMHLTMKGFLVISLACFGHADVPTGAKFLTSDGDESTPEKKHLDQIHFRKIDISDGIFVVNPGGYIGSSTRREIEYAKSQGKFVDYLFQEPSHVSCAHHARPQDAARDMRETGRSPFDVWAEWLLLQGLAIYVECGRGDYILVLETPDVG